ncbi:hypothetical protein [Kitasatospora sp. NBC_01302]|uniref:hypothetical protein n=1 Tax=Kitasatospora sp. NBC_01302 TaxID=2903575 RepID=UPI002E107771|nr:hypothetical protein OG294_39190 [Kitasatospora sp. NBC_01302]
MTAAPSTAWSVTLDYSHDIAFALAIRDALGFTDPLGLPPIDPPLPLTPLQDTVPEIESRWQAWWEFALASPGHESNAAQSLHGPLGALVRRHSTELLAWSSQRKRELAKLSRTAPGQPRTRLADAIHEHGRKTGNQFPEFHLTIIAIPVAGTTFTPVNKSSAIVASIELMRDRNAYFSKIIEHLVGT